MSTADPSDVKGVIETDLADSQIQSYLDDAAYENEQANDVGGMSTEAVTQVEKYLAALMIREFRDRAIKSGSTESADVEYEGPSLRALRRKVQSRDPSGTLATNRDTDRTISTS